MQSTQTVRTFGMMRTGVMLEVLVAENNTRLTHGRIIDEPGAFENDVQYSGGVTLDSSGCYAVFSPNRPLGRVRITQQVHTLPHTAG